MKKPKNHKPLSAALALALVLGAPFAPAQDLARKQKSYTVRSLTPGAENSCTLEIGGPNTYAVRRTLTEPLLRRPGYGVFPFEFVVYSGPLKCLAKIPADTPAGVLLRDQFELEARWVRLVSEKFPVEAFSHPLFGRTDRVPVLVFPRITAAAPPQLAARDFPGDRNPGALLELLSTPGLGLIDRAGVPLQPAGSLLKILRQVIVLYQDNVFFAGLPASRRQMLYRELAGAARDRRPLDLGLLASLTRQSRFNVKIMFAEIIDHSVDNQPRLAPEYREAAVLHYDLVRAAGIRDEYRVFLAEKALAAKLENYVAGQKTRARLLLAGFRARGVNVGDLEQRRALALPVDFSSGAAVVDFSPEGAGRLDLTPRTVETVFSAPLLQAPAHAGPAAETFGRDYGAALATAFVLLGQTPTAFEAGSLYLGPALTLNPESGTLRKLARLLDELYGFDGNWQAAAFGPKALSDTLTRYFSRADS